MSDLPGADEGCGGLTAPPALRQPLPGGAVPAPPAAVAAAGAGGGAAASTAGGAAGALEAVQFTVSDLATAFMCSFYFFITDILFNVE